MAGRSWSGLVQQWGVSSVAALQLQKSIASLMREVGPSPGGSALGGVNRAGSESRVLTEEAMGMLEAARTARRLREPGWCGEKGQRRWQAKQLLEWAARERLRAGGTLQLHSIHIWVTSPSVKLIFMDSQSLSQVLKIQKQFEGTL